MLTYLSIMHRFWDITICTFDFWLLICTKFDHLEWPWTVIEGHFRLQIPISQRRWKLGTQLLVTGPGDLRLISVTSILCRTVEQVVVKNYLTPLLDSTPFYDQFAYKPTGSTTCSLADLRAYIPSTYYIHCVRKKGHVIFYYNSRISWSIF